MLVVLVFIQLLVCCWTGKLQSSSQKYFGIGIRRRLQLVGVGTGVREDKKYCTGPGTKEGFPDTLWFYIITLKNSAVGYVTAVIHGSLATVVMQIESGCNTGRQHQAEPPAYAQCPRLSFAFAFVVPVAMCIANAGYEHGR